MENGYIFIDNNVFPSLFAISSEEQSRGLMFEPWPPPIMSFIYSAPQFNSFWMKNTPSPLDIVFCCDGTVKQICYGKPFSTDTIGGTIPSDMIIEFPSGTVELSSIKIGNKVGLVKPTKNELKEILAQKYHKFVKW